MCGHASILLSIHHCLLCGGGGGSPLGLVLEGVLHVLYDLQLVLVHVCLLLLFDS